MAFLPVNLYRDFLLKQVDLPFVPGLAAAHGTAADLSTWNALPALGGEEETKAYYISGATLGEGAFTLSSGSTIWNATIGASLPWIDDAKTDDPSNDNTYPPIYNPLFSGAWVNPDTNTRYTYTISIVCTSNYGGYTRPNFDLRLYLYTQTPDDSTGTTRETWSYSDAAGFSSGRLRSTLDESSKYTLVKIYNLYIGDKEFYMLAFGVSADGEYFTEQGSEFITYFVAIPKTLFQDKEVKPWVGPPGEDDSEEGFEPTEEKHDVIAQRQLSNEQRNPFGINSGSGGGIRVVFPNLQTPGGTLTRDNYLSYILGCIYRGEATGLFNRFEQTFASSLGGNTHRPADEVSAMISAIICCHSVPMLANYGENRGSITSLGGYPLDLQSWGLHYFKEDSADYGLYLYKANNFVMPNKSIFDARHTSNVISPRLNCFLDYEPYTNMTLQIPFFKPVSLSPSMVYGNRINVEYRIDILTGLLQAAIYVGTTLVEIMTTNVKTDIPIVGQGANGGGLSKIMTAISSMTNSTSNAELIKNGVGAALQTADAISGTKSGTVVGKEGSPSLAPYLSPRTAYLMITHPKAAIPVAQGDGKFNEPTFLNQVGMRANLAYKVSELAGGWNKISSIDLSTVQAPQAVKDDILAQLMQGVYIK